MSHIIIFLQCWAKKSNAPCHLHHHQHTADLSVCLKGMKHLHVLKSFCVFFPSIFLKQSLITSCSFLHVTVCPLSPMPRSLHLCLVWEGSCAPSASPWIDPSATPSCSCDTSARWRPTPGGSRRRCRHRRGWSCSWTPVEAARAGHWWSLSLLRLALLAVVQKGQSRVQRLKKHLWCLRPSSSAGTPSTTWSSPSSSLTGGRELERGTDAVSNSAVDGMRCSPLHQYDAISSVRSLYQRSTCSDVVPDLHYSHILSF